MICNGFMLFEVEIVYVPHAKRCINPLPMRMDLPLLNFNFHRRQSNVSIATPQAHIHIYTIALIFYMLVCV